MQSIVNLTLWFLLFLPVGSLALILLFLRNKRKGKEKLEKKEFYILFFFFNGKKRSLALPGKGKVYNALHCKPTPEQSSLG
jgi:hypothetical protein